MRHIFAICLCSASLWTMGAQESQAQFYGVRSVRQSCCYGSYYAPTTSYYTPVTSYYAPLVSYYQPAAGCCPTAGCNTCGTSSCCSTTVGYAPAQNCCGTNNCCASTGCCATGCNSGCSTGCCGSGGCANGDCVTGGNIDRVRTTASAQPRLRSRDIAVAVPPQRQASPVETRFVNADATVEPTPLVRRATLRTVTQKPSATSNGWEPIR